MGGGVNHLIRAALFALKKHGSPLQRQLHQAVAAHRRLGFLELVLRTTTGATSGWAEMLCVAHLASLASLAQLAEQA